MKTNTLGKVSMQTANRPRARFDLSHNINTTFGFGETQPLTCRLLVPGTKTIVSNESLIRLAPMVSPTFGLMKLKTWHYFVGMSDLTRNFSALLGQTKITRGDRVFYPEKVPHCRLDILSAMILNGAHCSIWRNSSAEADSRTDVSSFTTWDTHTHSSEYNQCIANLGSYIGQEQFSVFDNYNGFWLDLACVCPRLPLTDGGNSRIWLQNTTRESFFQKTNDQDQIVTTDSNGLDDSLVYLDTADYVTIRTINGTTYAFAFRLSSFGKRLRKILLGCGYQINMQDDTLVNLMPLFAYYKAYYDIFGLMLYSNWDTTYAAQLLEWYDMYNISDFAPCYIHTNEINKKWFSFLRDLGSCWTTDEQDFISAHTRTIGVSPSLNLDGEFISIGNDNETDPNITIPSENDEDSSTGWNQQAFINRVFHGQVDSELLKRLYKWTNRNTIAGKRLEALLRAQGLGDYVDSCKPRFIGYTEVDIDISDVVAQSDTFNEATGEGSQLGQYGGRGIGYDPKASAKTFEYENDEFGYWVTLAAIVPLAGYTQMLDGNNKCIKKLDFYNPEFDGVGPEATPKDLVVGSQNFVSEADSPLTDTFGFISKYSSLKVAGNLMNGDFNLRSTRDVYVPFTIDKILDVGERWVKNVAAGGINSALLRKLFKPSEVPLAGPNPWRYGTRYAWLGNFNRIFSYKGDIGNFDASKVGFIEWFGSVPENFMCHNTLRFVCQSPMLPIADSFETNEDGNDGKPNANISKA